MPLVYIGRNEHFLTNGMVVVQTGLFSFKNSPVVFITLQNAKNRHEICTIKEADTWYIEDKDHITCDLVEIFQYTDCVSQYTNSVSSFFVHDAKKHLSELLEWHQERWSNIGSKIVPNVQTNPTEAFSPYSDKYPWMLENYSPPIND